MDEQPSPRKRRNVEVFDSHQNIVAGTQTRRFFFLFLSIHGFYRILAIRYSQMGRFLQILGRTYCYFDAILDDFRL